jgi:hypothetical protein
MFLRTRRGTRQSRRPEKNDAHAVGVQFVLTALQQTLVEVHEVTNLVDGAHPVLGRKRVDRQCFHAERQRAVDRIDERFLAGPVSFGARQSLALGPAAVAVHHHAHVGWHASSVRGTRELAWDGDRAQSKTYLFRFNHQSWLAVRLDS